jgi:nicotinic acid mononucleotide adenylyltransferase
MIKERIGIFGCSADPFTLAHREIVKEALKQKLVDKVIIAPTIVDYHRGDKLPWLGLNERASIIHEMTKDLHPVFIDETELNRKKLLGLSQELEDHAVKNWRFIDTLLRIKLEYMNRGKTEREFYPIVGGDSLDNFTTWFAWKDILKQSAGLIAVERDNKPIDVKALISRNPEFDGKLKVMKIYDGFAEMSASDERESWRKHPPTEYLDWALATIEANKAAGRVDAKEKNLLLHTPIFDVIKGPKTKTGLEPVLVDAPDWVSIIVKRGREFLIEKQFRYGSNCDIEEFPCGMVEEGESPHEAVIRELEEETGIRISLKDIKYLGATNPNPAFMTNRMHYFYVDLDKSGYEQHSTKLDQHENIELHWEDMDDFCKRILNLAKHSSPKVPAILLSAFAFFTANAIAIDS